jgi:PmbA protein
MVEHSWRADVAERLLALCRGKADQAEVYTFESEQLPVSFESNRLKSSERRHTQGVALRLIKEGKLGAATAMGPSDPKALVERAVALAAYGPEAPFAFAGPASVAPVEGLYSSETANLPLDAMVNMGRRIVESVLEQRPDVLVDVDVSKQVDNIGLFTSKGASFGYRRTALRVSVHVNRVADTDLLDVYDDLSGVFPVLDLNGLVNRLVQKVRWAEKVVPPAQGQVPVLFTPKGAAMLFLGPLQHAFNGKSVLEGSSPLAGKLGERVFNPEISLRDIGMAYGVPGSRPVDDEGLPTQDRWLVNGGRVTAFYYDLQTASRASVDPTGNGTRISPGIVQPGRNLWAFPTGSHDFEGLLNSYPRGLVVDQVMGAWAANIMAGEFSGNVHLGYLFDGGEVVGRVKNTMIAGNVFRCLSGAVTLGADTQWIGGTVSIPSILVETVNVAASSGSIR